MSFRYTSGSTALEFDGLVDWDEVPKRIEIKRSWGTCITLRIKCSKHPVKEGLYCDFEQDGWDMDIEEFKQKWGILELYKLGKYHCAAGYTDRLHPEKSWWGHNPALLKRLDALKAEEWVKELDSVS